MNPHDYKNAPDSARVFSVHAVQLQSPPYATGRVSPPPLNRGDRYPPTDDTARGIGAGLSLDGPSASILPVLSISVSVVVIDGEGREILHVFSLTGKAMRMDKKEDKKEIKRPWDVLQKEKKKPLGPVFEPNQHSN